MGSTYNISHEIPSVEEFVKLRKLIGWGRIDSSLAKKSLQNSLFSVVVRDDSKLIAMGRVVGDGAMYFYVQDIIVNPNYQRQGVGHLIMSQIDNYLGSIARKGATIGLLASKGKESFYTRYGFTARPNNTLGNGMCKFI